jgi:hypothetical protein
VHAVTGVLASMARGVDADEAADRMDQAWLKAARTPSGQSSEAEAGRSEDAHEATADTATIARPVRGGGGGEPLFRRASEGAQLFVVDRLVTTVFMQGSSAVRRITERVVTAQADGVEFYTARSFSGRDTSGRDYVPIQALWGCQAETVPSSRPGDPVITRLRFPRPLRKGEKASFASEALFAPEPEEYDIDWVDVDIDHHGIVPGRTAFADTFPLSGLTIRVRFDLDFLPVVAWYYAELTEQERATRPSDEDRLLEIQSGEVSYTFTDVACQPRESYGIGWQWPTRNR